MFLETVILGGHKVCTLLQCTNDFQGPEIFDVFSKSGSLNRGWIQAGKSTTWHAFIIWRFLTWRVLSFDLTGWVNNSVAVGHNLIVRTSPDLSSLDFSCKFPGVREVISAPWTSPANFPGCEK